MRKQLARKQVLFVLSVDTEEEFDWSGDFPQENCSVENVGCLPAFQEFCVSLQVRPTYLVDYPVAAHAESAAILRNIAQSGKAEIGAHLHPWCTPPFEGANTEFESHVVNLPPDLVQRKLAELTAVIQRQIGVTPTVFRTGRWGINGAVLQILAQAGYKVDSSIYPYYANEYFSCLDASDRPYWPDFSNPDVSGAQRALFELPVTAGFNRVGFPFWGRVHRLLSSPALRPLRPVGVAWRTHALRKIYLSPELATAADMKALVAAGLADDHPVMHLFLHSSTLLPGRNEYTLDHSDRDDLFGSIRNVVAFLSEQADVTFCTISEAVGRLKPGLGDVGVPAAT
ncbi:MAG TPA: polysaccharide deacetylase family protein [Dongiaceae bacterium]|nr:polysaccharide deacetylase family protein [Dongiaceae bacterium]